MINLFIVEDHPAVIEGIKIVLNNINIIGTASNGEEALNYLIKNVGIYKYFNLLDKEPIK